jgi:hypothetical protein
MIAWEAIMFGRTHSPFYVLIGGLSGGGATSVLVSWLWLRRAFRDAEGFVVEGCFVSQREPPPLASSEQAEPIIAWRAWSLARDGDGKIHLCSLTQPVLWPLGSPLCSGIEPPHYWGHAYPNPGIFALKEPSMIDLGNRTYGIVGTVALWGKVIEHADGYRAEYAYPQHLIVPPGVPDAENVARELARAYGCEVEVESGTSPDVEARMAALRRTNYEALSAFLTWSPLDPGIHTIMAQPGELERMVGEEGAVELRALYAERVAAEAT